jgi:hypothetical protein
MLIDASHPEVREGADRPPTRTLGANPMEVAA